MGVRFGSVDLEAGRRWFAAAKEGLDTVTVAQRNGAVATIAALMDALADPQTVLPRVANAAQATGVSLGELNLPVMTYRGEDPQLRGHDVPLLGALPVPSWWPSGGAAPSSLPAWVRDTDRERRNLYGALAWVLDRLAGEGQRNPQQGTGRGTTGNLVLVGVIALAGIAAGAYIVRGVAGDYIRETQETHRFAEQAATAVKLYVERLKVFRDTGTMPPASPAETALNPAPAANGAPPSGSVGGRGASWWSEHGGDALKVGAGAAAAAGLAGLVAWAVKKLRKPTQPQVSAGALPPQVQPPRGPTPPAQGRGA